MTESGLSIPERLKNTVEEADDRTEVDDLLDSLPATIRNQILDATSKKEDKAKPYGLVKRTAWWTGLALSLLWAVPWMAICLAAFMTIILFPIGLVAWGIGAAPSCKLIEAKVNNPAEKPWKRI